MVSSLPADTGDLLDDLVARTDGECGHLGVFASVDESADRPGFPAAFRHTVEANICGTALSYSARPGATLDEGGRVTDLALLLAVFDDWSLHRCAG